MRTVVRRLSSAATGCGIRARSRTPRAGISIFPTALEPWATWPTCWGARNNPLGSGIDDQVRYFYDLVIRHEDMHVEALTEHAPDPEADALLRNLGAVELPRPGPLPGDVVVPVFLDRLDLGRRLHLRQREMGACCGPAAVQDRPRGLPYAEFAAFVEAGCYRTREFWSDAGWTWREQRGAEQPVYWQGKRDGVRRRAAIGWSRNWRRTHPSCS